MSQVANLLRAANPVPNPEAALTDQVRAEISFKIAEGTDGTHGTAGTDGPDDTEPTVGNSGRRAKRLVGAGCFAVLLAVAAIAMLADRPPTNEAASSAPVDLAEEYIAARNQWDTEKTLALLSPDAAVSEFPIVRGTGELPALITYLQLAEETVAVSSCDPVPGEPTTVICYYELSNVLSRHVASPSLFGSFRIESDSGLITSISNTVDSEAILSPYMWSWLDWLENNTEDGPDGLYRWALHNDSVLPTPRLDNLEPFGMYLDEYLSPTP